MADCLQYLFERCDAAEPARVGTFVEGMTEEQILSEKLSGPAVIGADFERILEFLEPVNSKDYINLKHYYDIAINNQREYSKLSYLYKTVSNKPLDLIHSAKKKVKVYEDDAA